jgi:hypothetical protein
VGAERRRDLPAGPKVASRQVLAQQSGDGRPADPGRRGKLPL